VTICASCGVDNPERAKFCLECGTALTEVERPERFRRTVTVLFSDVVGSTALGERLDPETLSQVMTDYFAAVRPAVEHHGGTLAKFIGDAVMAVFGLVQLHEDDALRAARAAVEMRATLARLNPELERRYGVELTTRTGINTGPVAGRGLVPDQNFVAGDTANTAARLQTAAGEDEILLGQATYRLVRDAVEADLLPPLQAKGKAAPLTVYRLIAVLPEEERTARGPRTSLVGREGELAALREVFRRCVRERVCGLVTLIAPPGVGKSRLVREFLTEIGSDAEVLEGRCLPYGEGITYWPLAQMVRRAAAIKEVDSAEQALAKLRALAPDAAVAAGVAQAVGLRDAGLPAAEIAWAARRLLESAAARRPLVCVCDDVQWAEPALLDLLEQVAERARDAPVLLCCLGRPELLESRPAWPGVMELLPLTADESERLLDVLLDHARIGPSDRERIAHAAEGNPLFIEQLVSMLVDEGLLGDRSALEPLPVPPTIQALLASRLERLELPERHVLTRAAVIGQAFDRGTLADLVSDRARPGLDQMIAALVRKDFLLPAGSDLGSKQSFAFRHLLIRDAAYEALTKEDRAQLHEQLADRLDSTMGDRIQEVEEVIGYHLEQAHQLLSRLRPLDDHGRGLAVRAAQRLASAGKRAYGRADARAAVGLLERALALLPPEPGRRAELVHELGRSYHLLYDPRAAEAHRQAAELARAAGDRGLELLIELEVLANRASTEPEEYHPRMRRAAERAIPVFAALGDERGLARAYRRIGDNALVSGRLDEACEAYEGSLVHAAHTDDVGLRSITKVLLAGALTYGRLPASEAEVRVRPVLGRLEGHRVAEIGVRDSLAWLEAIRGRFEAARRLCAQNLALAHEEEPDLAMMSATVALLAGDAADAERILRPVCRQLDQLGDHGTLCYAAPLLAEALLLQGKNDEALELTRLAERITATFNLECGAQWRKARAKLLARNAQHDAAEKLAREAVELVRRTDLLALQAEVTEDLAEVLASGGRVDEARAAANDALMMFERKEHVIGAARTRGLLARLDAWVATR